MRFSQSDAATENHIVFLLDEPESEQVFYLKMVDFLGPENGFKFQKLSAL